MHDSILEGVIRDLDAARGSWPQISRDTGVPYFTITNIAQRRVENPGVQTVQKLVDYFAMARRAA